MWISLLGSSLLDLIKKNGIPLSEFRGRNIQY